MPDEKIRVLVVDDHRVVRVGLRALIDAEADMRVVAEADSGASARAAQAEHRPDVILLDLRLPDVNGAELVAALAREGARIIVLTSYHGDEDIFRAVEAGARGYLLKGSFPEGMLEEAIRAVHRGERRIPAEVAERLADRLSSPGLTPREVAVLELVARGLSNREIGSALSTSPGTVKTHLRRIYEKLGVSDRTSAAMVATQRGFFPPP